MFKVSVRTSSRLLYHEISKIVENNHGIKIDNICLDPDVLVLYRNNENINLTTKVLIICNGEECNNVSAQIAVSCGISETNTITLSSTGVENEMASLQRDILSLKGNLLEPREINLGNIKGSTEEKLLIAALKLVLEVD